VGFFVGLHLTLVPLIWLVAGAATVWGIVLLVRHRGIDRVMRVLVGVVAGLGVVQAAIGGLLYITNHRPADNLHFVYGLIVLVAIPVAYTYADNKADADARSLRRDMIVFTVAAAVVLAAAVRAFMTGCPPAGCAR
jgi:hypothetical protein